ncbi:MAG: hypothetical protein ING44_06060 [Telmatospirillum sp.]|nr:hypothetical protein [Telmatospirillum sp.]
MLNRSIFLVAASAFMVGLLPAAAHDFGRSITTVTPAANAVLTGLEKINFAAASEADKAIARAHVARSLHWEPGGEVTVCFSGSTEEIYQRVIAVAERWTAHGALKLETKDGTVIRTCGLYQNSAIRVSLDPLRKPGHFESYVGKESLKYKSDYSMNLPFDSIQLSDDKNFEFLVLHEFGHALGFLHEHQRSNNCFDELDVAAVQRDIPWTVDEIRTQMQALPDSSPYFQGSTRLQPAAIGQFDTRSVMMYNFPYTWFRDPNTALCWRRGVHDLSEGDKLGMRTIYGNPWTKRIETVALVEQLGALSALPSNVLERLDRSIADLGNPQRYNAFLALNPPSAVSGAVAFAAPNTSPITIQQQRLRTGYTAPRTRAPAIDSTSMLLSPDMARLVGEILADIQANLD